MEQNALTLPSLACNPIFSDCVALNCLGFLHFTLLRAPNIQGLFIPCISEGCCCAGLGIALCWSRESTTWQMSTYAGLCTLSAGA